MAPLGKKETVILQEKEEKLYKALDKGIDDMEKGCTVLHEEAMDMIRERIKSYGV